METPSVPPRFRPRPTATADAPSPRRRQTHSGRRRPSLQVPLPESETRPISWPEEFKRALPVGRLIRLASNVPVDVKFFTSLNYDVRRAVYDTFLQSAGFRQHIYCPSVSRTRQTKELYSRYILSGKCDDAAFSASLSCGHWECRGASGGGKDPEFRLADLIALMKTCKFGYLEVSEYLYRSVTFTFASFPEMRVFLDRTPESVISHIRAVAFIAHMLPQNPQACQRFIKGEYFQTEGEDAITLFKRFSNLEVLEISFFPSLILALSSQIEEVVNPLNQLPEGLEVIVSVPNIVYDGAQEVGLPPASRLGEGDGITLRRPAVSGRHAQQQCKAYSYQF